MDPDDPARKQVYAKLTGRLQLSNRTNLWMRYEQNIYHDFTTNRPPSSRLPNVRTQVARYLVQGQSGIEQLYLEHKKASGRQSIAEFMLAFWKVCTAVQAASCFIHPTNNVGP